MQVEIDFAQRLNALRLQAGLTQEHLAERAGLSARGISDLERGLRRPRPETISRLAGVLHIDSGVLAGRVPRTVEIPAALDAFVGRDEELVTLGEDLRSPNTRLLTLVGPPGVGKSRLARELAAREEGAFANGAAFIRLCVLRRSDEFAEFLAAELHLASFKALRAHLSTQRFLLILDNIEHLPAIVDDVVTLLEDAPGLTIMATGRRSLLASGEHVREITTLPVPSGNSAREILGAPSARLFVSRVRERFALPLGERGAPALGRIVRAFEGLPLAIELSAMRLASIDVEALAASIEHEVCFEEGLHDHPEHSRSLRSSLKWSLNALKPAQREFLTRLSAFVGLYSIAAAASSTGVSLEQAQRHVEVLRASHLVLPGPHPSLLQMLAAIRVPLLYELEQSGQLESTRAAHARWYLRAAETEALDGDVAYEGARISSDRNRQ